MGGRKKKCEFPPLAPSVMERAARTLGAAVGRSLSEHAAANNRMTEVIDRRQKRGIISVSSRRLVGRLELHDAARYRLLSLRNHQEVSGWLRPKFTTPVLSVWRQMFIVGAR
jgi:hypothetical protein